MDIEHLNQFFQDSNDFIICTDEDFLIEDANNNVLNLFNSEEKDIQGAHLSDFISLGNNTSLEALKKTLLVNNVLTDIEFNFKKSHQNLNGSVLLHDKYLLFIFKKNKHQKKANDAPPTTGSELREEDHKLFTIISDNLRIKTISLSHEKSNGDTQEHLKEKKFLDVIHPDDSNQIKNELLKLSKEQKCTLSPYRLKGKNDRWHWVQSICKKQENGSGKEDLLIATYEIAELIEKSEALQLSNERLETLMNIGSENVWDLNLKTGELYLSKSFKIKFGITPKHLHENNEYINTFIHPLDQDFVFESFQEALANKAITQWEQIYRFYNIEGNCSFVKDKAIIRRDESGKAYRAIGSLQDITSEFLNDSFNLFEREAMINALNLNVKFKKVLDNLFSSIEKLLPFVKISFMNHRKDKLFHFLSPSLPENFTHLFHQQNTKHSQLPFCIAARKKQKIIAENIYENKNWKNYDAYLKRHKLVDCWSFPIVGSEKKVVALLIVYLEKRLPANNGYIRIFEKTASLISVLYNLYKNVRQLEESNLRNSYVNHVSKDAIYEWDIFNDRLKWGEGYKRNFGYESFNTPDKLSQWKAKVHPNDIEDVMESLHAFLKDTSDNKWQADYRYKKANGRYIYVNEIGYAVRNKQGEAKKMIGVLRDQTDTKELQELLKNVSKLSKIGGWEIDLVNNHYFWSTVTKEIHEVEESFEPNMQVTLNFYHKDYRENITKLMNTAIRSGTPYEFEAPIITQNGNKRWVKTNGNAEFEGDKCVRLYGSFQDIHERKIAQIRLKSLSDNIPGVIFQYHLLNDGTDAFYNVSKGVKEVFEVSPENFMNNSAQTWEGVRLGGDLEPLIKSIEKSAENLEKWHAKWRHVLPNGRLKWLEGHGSPQKLPDDSVLWDTLVIDITDKQELEILAKRTAELARIGSWEMDFTNGTSGDLYLSPVTRQIFELKNGYSPTYRDLLREFLPGSEKKLHQALKNLLKSGKEFDLEILIKTNKGNKTWVRCKGSSERIAAKCTKIFGSVQHIHERKLAEAELRKSKEELKKRAKALAASNLELQQFAYIASHDLQEPLRMISSFLARLDAKYAPQLDSKAKQYIDFAVDGANRMRKIILALLDFSRADRYEQKPEAVDLNKLMDEIMLLNRKIISDKNARIHYEKLPVIHSYPTPVLQVFQNLITNGIKYSKANVNPEIRIYCEELATDWQFCVSDNGIGIDPEYYEKIFIIFQRLHSAQEYEGTGIGLAIVKKVINAIGGQIWLSSELNHGTSFYFTIPKLKNKK